MSTATAEATGVGTHPPDIVTDRIYVVMGAATFFVHDTPVALVDEGLVWITQVQTEETTFDREAREAGRPYFPGERSVRVGHELYIGTVDEHVEDYRKRLTQAFHSLCLTPPEGRPQPPIPQFGEPHLGQQRAVLARLGVDGPTTVPPAPEALAAREEVRIAKAGWRPRQDAVMRDRLRRLVAMFANWGPTGNAKHVDELIAALAIFKEDGPLYPGQTPASPTADAGLED